MRTRGHDNTVYYDRLKDIRDAVAGGAEYTTVNLAPFLIAYIGAHIPDVNYNLKSSVDKKEFIGARGDKVKAAKDAVKWFKDLKNK
jgi:hypothetical protein